MSTPTAAESTPLRLHLNEFNGGCAPAVVEALRTLTASDLAHYPDDRAATRRAAARLGVDAEQVCLTNGLDDGIHAVARLAGPDGEAVLVEPSFDTYGLAAKAAGLTAVRVLPGADLRVGAGAVLDVVGPRTRLVFLNDPQNPTGLALPSGLAGQVAAAAPWAIVFVDEAYAEFSGRSILAQRDRPANVIVGRTFAKAYGLAGLRVGALVGTPATIEALRERQPIFHVNVCAVRALEAALGTPEFVAGVVAQAQTSRGLIERWCRARSLVHWPSEANFVLIRVGEAAPRIAAAMAERGVLVRDRSASPGCAGCLRVTAGLPEETRTALEILEDVLASLDC